MSKTETALKLALEALEVATTPLAKDRQEVLRARAAIREALAQPEQEPVAFYVYKPTLPQGHLGNVSDGDLPWVYDQDPSSGYSARMLVYTTPSQRKPLTDEEIDKLPWGPHEGNPLTFAEGLRDFARAIEQAHGIKE